MFQSRKIQHTLRRLALSLPLFFIALGLRPSLNKLAAGVYRAMNDAGRFGTRFVSVFGTSSIGVSEKSLQTPAWFGTHHVLTVEAGPFPNNFILIF